MVERLFFVGIGADCMDDEAQEAMTKLYNALNIDKHIEKGRFVLIKIHFGEDKTDRFIRPKFVKPIVDSLVQAGAKVVLGDTNTLYPGRRSNAIDHMMLSYEHGFKPESVGCPVMILDGLIGGSVCRVGVEGRHFKEVELAYDLQFFDLLIVMTHVTGHLLAGLGGTIKNIGMGLATRSGKLAQHNSQPLKIDEKRCTACGTCAKWCPQKAITVEKKSVVIDDERCVSCGWCVAVCKQHAIKFSWDISHTVIQERIAEYACGVYKLFSPNLVCFNFLQNVYANCDCMKDGGERLCEDIGIIAGSNPAAVDYASLELIKETLGEDPFLKIRPNIDHTVQIRHFAKLCSINIDFEMVRLTLLGEERC